MIRRQPIHRVSSVLFFVFLFGFSLTHADPAPLIQDSYVADGNGQTGNQNHGTKTFFRMSDIGPKWGLVQFDLSALGGTVTSAILTFNVTNVDFAGNLDLHVVLTPWNESTVTFNTAPTFNPTSGATIAVVVEDIGGNVSLDITAIAQAWIDNPGSNHGLALVASSADVRFSSKEGVMGANLEVMTDGGDPPPPPPPPGAASTISSVLLDFDSDLMIISGQNFDNGDPPVLNLGDVGTLSVVPSPTDTMIEVDLPPGLPDGDYLLTVSTGPASEQNATYDLTIGAVGPEGLQGIQGKLGPAGGDGVDGAQGAQGKIGPAGADGAQGVQGKIGPAGADGVDGAQGTQGKIGPAGADGSDGTQGVQGKIGPAGADGADGAQGAQGKIGPAGADSTVPGPQGEQGKLGPQGDTGAQGVQGKIGPAGADGADGPQGAQGKIGPAGADSTVPGPQGEQGKIGPAGADGVDGAQGAQGKIGPAGADSTVPGPQGVQGKIGPAGADSTVPGPQGEQGKIGPAGADGAQGAQGKIGPAGADGAQGVQGKMGPAGADSTVPGPQGVQGKIGPAGADGVDGAQGVQGKIGPAGADSTVPGPQGVQGKIGPAGADSAVPGPQGEQGKIGPQGAPGTNTLTGGDQAHNNMEPFVTLNCIIAYSSEFWPAHIFPVNGNTNIFIGEVKWFLGDFAPNGFEFCDGQLLPVVGAYEQLFALIGTTYGGDGINNFALPNVRGRKMIHEGTGPGLTNRPLASDGGAETHTLTTGEMPSHTH